MPVVCCWCACGGVPVCAVQVLARPDSFDVAVTTYEMVTSAEFGRPIQSTIVSAVWACVKLIFLCGIASGLVCRPLPPPQQGFDSAFWRRGRGAV